MLLILIAVICLLGLISLPYWLPRAVVALRMRIFARINGSDGIEIPGTQVDISEFMRIYADPAASGRSRGAALSDLFWYWLSPGPDVHQEHLEPGPRYDQVARTTRRILAMPTGTAEDLTRRCLAGALPHIDRPTVVRLRDMIMPVWAEFFYELVFGTRCPRQARELIVGNANDVVTAMKCCGLRHMSRRLRLTRFLEERVNDVPHVLPASLTPREHALYLHGTFFTTGVVQMSEAMAHLLMVIAHHPDEQARLAQGDDDRLLDHVIEETLRLYPLFGIAHRISSDDITLDSGTMLPAGSVLCFNYPRFHRSGFANADTFVPARWSHTPVRDANHIPFGVAANRPCPAWHLAPIVMRVAGRELLRRYTFASSAAHTRSIPNRGPSLLTPRGQAPARFPHALLLALLRLCDRWEDVWRSLTQLVLGTYMVLDARRLGLCTRYFSERPYPENAKRPRV